MTGFCAVFTLRAVLLLWLRTPQAPQKQDEDIAVKVPSHWKPRPADALIGPISRDRAGDAATRIDAIYADRLDGYRERTLARGRTP